MTLYKIMAAALLSIIGVLSPGSSPDGFRLETEGSYRNGNMILTEVWNGNTLYAHEIRMFRRHERMKAKYFASGAVRSKFQAWKQQKDVALVCSGAFSDYSGSGTSSFIPYGLTVDNGTIVNRSLDPVMDGLVIVYATGGIAVSDLDEQYIQLQSENRKVDLRIPQDKEFFLNWAQKQQATVFQTQLLVYKDKLRFQPHLARKKLAKRRFLALARDRIGNLYHLIYDLQDPVYLGEAAQAVLGYLNQAQQLEVIAMMNLDTGRCDYLSVVSDYSTELAAPKGSRPISDATNLLAFYFE